MKGTNSLKDTNYQNSFKNNKNWNVPASVQVIESEVENFLTRKSRLRCLHWQILPNIQGRNDITSTQLPGKEGGRRPLLIL
jgi:hypothetical protein